MTYDYGNNCHIKQYLLVGRAKPKAGDLVPQVFRMRIFATNDVTAKSRFWNFMSKLRKIKRANGELLHIEEVFEKTPGTVKNFGIWLRYNSRHGTHNMYREYRDTALTGAVSQMYNEMGGKHRAKFDSIQIMKTAVLEKDNVRRPNTLQFVDDDIKFPLIRERMPKIDKKYKTVFKYGAVQRTY